MNNRRAARKSAPHLLLVAYLAMNAFGLVSTFSLDLSSAEDRARFQALYSYVAGAGSGVFLLVGSLLFLHDKVISPRARVLIVASTLVGLGQVIIVLAGFFLFDRTGRNLGELGSRLGFVLACALVSLVAWQPNDTSTRPTAPTRGRPRRLGEDQRTTVFSHRDEAPPKGFPPRPRP